MDQIKDSIEYGSVVMEYTVEYRDRKTLGICVHPDGSVDIKAPVETPLEQIRNTYIVVLRGFANSNDIFPHSAFTHLNENMLVENPTCI